MTNRSKFMNDKVSIVVPIYNVQEYLKECLDSIINQTYTNLEIILVHDGSPDNCLTICRQYEKKDSRIKVIDKKNGGLSDARNTGLKASTGKYICFIDSDDYVHNKYIELLYNAISTNSSDIAICKFQKYTKNEELKEIKKSQFKKCNIINYNNREILKNTYQAKIPNTEFVAWNKLYKIELFKNNNIEYPKGRVFEDGFTTFKLLYHSKKTTIVDAKLYFYRIRTGSIMQSKFNDDKIKDYIDSDCEAVKYFAKLNENTLLCLALNSMLRNSRTLRKIINKNEISKQTKKYVNTTYKNYIIKYKKYINTLKIIRYYIGKIV